MRVPATRYLETTLGVLSYAELAPHLAQRVLAAERRIESGDYDEALFDTALLLELQRQLCESLTPQFLGLRGVDVKVGKHTPPPFYQVPELMREYELDLGARLSDVDGVEQEQLLECLAFAEGRLLSIHPFADFNGRVTRLFLRLLLRRLDLPAVDLVPSQSEVSAYLEALAAGDRFDWQPLAVIWAGRLKQGA